jgi:hypothetical protein
MKPLNRRASCPTGSATCTRSRYTHVTPPSSAPRARMLWPQQCAVRMHDEHAEGSRHACARSASATLRRGRAALASEALQDGRRFPATSRQQARVLTCGHGHRITQRPLSHACAPESAHTRRAGKACTEHTDAQQTRCLARTAAVERTRQRARSAPQAVARTSVRRLQLVACLRAREQAGRARTATRSHACTRHAPRTRAARATLAQQQRARQRRRREAERPTLARASRAAAARAFA